MTDEDQGRQVMINAKKVCKQIGILGDQWDHRGDNMAYLIGVFASSIVLARALRADREQTFNAINKAAVLLAEQIEANNGQQ